MWEALLILICTLVLALVLFYILGHFFPRVNPCTRCEKLCCATPNWRMNIGTSGVLIFCFLFVNVVESFKLPSFNTNLNTDIENAHDQFQDSIVNSTITSINLSVVHVASEVVLLLLIVCSHKKLSALIHQISTHLVRSKKTFPNVPQVTSV